MVGIPFAHLRIASSHSSCVVKFLRRGICAVWNACRSLAFAKKSCQKISPSFVLGLYRGSFQNSIGIVPSLLRALSDLPCQQDCHADAVYRIECPNVNPFFKIANLYQTRRFLLAIAVPIILKQTLHNLVTWSYSFVVTEHRVPAMQRTRLYRLSPSLTPLTSFRVQLALRVYLG